MSQPIFIIDAFADRPFEGNPAAVCVLPGPADEAWMAAVAREMNLSETAFLHPIGGDGDFSLRWFTPRVEVDLCGHATLASAHVLWTEGHLPGDREVRFRTRSGPLSARRVGEEIELDFPELTITPVEAPADLGSAIGAELLRVLSTGMDLLVEVANEQMVRTLAPDLGRIAALPVRGVIVTSRASVPEYHFVSRFFAPRCGVSEDPVTGSAHCALAPFWGERLGLDAMVGFQASERGGSVRVRREAGRVKLGGRAITVLRGAIRSATN